jgi:CheY-like chemotaxis protein
MQNQENIFYGSLPARVLVVEDSPEDARLTCRAIERSGFTALVDTVMTAEEAARLLFDGRGPAPDLILLDLNLPGMDGCALLSLLRKDAHLGQIPVLVFSSSREPGDVRRAYARGANCFLHKPDDAEEYMDLVRKAVWFWLHTAELPAPPAGRPSLGRTRSSSHERPSRACTARAFVVRLSS